LIRHEAPFGGLDSTALYPERIVNITIYQGALWTRRSSEGKATFAADLAVSAHLRVSGRSGVNQHRGTPELRRHRALLSIIDSPFGWVLSGADRDPIQQPFSSTRSVSYRRGKRGPTSVLVHSPLTLSRFGALLSTATPRFGPRGLGAAMAPERPRKMSGAPGGQMGSRAWRCPGLSPRAILAFDFNDRRPVPFNDGGNDPLHSMASG
jgi:hypothetical protein